MSSQRRLLVVLLLAATAATCPMGPTVVLEDLSVFGCVDLQLAVATDNVTVVIDGATGTINIISESSGTVLRLVGSIVTGDVVLGGPHAIVDLRGSTVTSAANVVLCTDGRNIAVVVANSTLTGAVVASIVVVGSDAVGASITVTESRLTTTPYAASVVVGTNATNVAIAVSRSVLALIGGVSDNAGVVALTATFVVNAVVNVTESSIRAVFGGNMA